MWCCGRVSYGFCRACDDGCVVLAEDFWNGSPEWVRVPYAKMLHLLWMLFPSSSALVKCAVNLPGPLGKPKYFLVTDSG